jgi:hypothetical protein
MRTKDDRVLESVWFKPKTTAPIGIVMVETPYDGIVFYIGLGTGLNEANDERMVAERGADFPWSVGIELFGKELDYVSE